jgi:hypothetical protein
MVHAVSHQERGRRCRDCGPTRGSGGTVPTGIVCAARTGADDARVLGVPLRPCGAQERFGILGVRGEAMKVPPVRCIEQLDCDRRESLRRS